MSKHDDEVMRHLKVTKCPDKAKFRYAFFELENNKEFMTKLRSFTNKSLEELFEKGFFCLLDISTIGLKRHEWLKEEEITEDLVADLVTVGSIVDLLTLCTSTAFNKIRLKKRPDGDYLN